MNDDISDMLPWYANGTLNPQERALVEAQLRARPELAGELQWIESLQAKVRESAPQVSDEIGLERAMARIAQDRRDAAVFTAPRSAAAPAASGWSERARTWLAGFGLRPAMAMALAVIAVQAGFLVEMTLTPRDTDQMRALPPGTAVVQGPLLKVNFKADATEADIRLLLVEVQGSIVGGPGQLGDYYLRVPAAGIEPAATLLRANRIVDAVSVVDAMPGKD